MTTHPACRAADIVSHAASPAGAVGVCPCSAGRTVMIEGLIAAHIQSPVTCSGSSPSGPVHPPGAPNYLVMGSKNVVVHGQPASRWDPSGDLALCTGTLGLPAIGASRSVIIGGTTVTELPAPTSDAETIAQAMFRVKTSRFAQTDEGRRLVDKLEDVYGANNVVYVDDDTIRGRWAQGGVLQVNGNNGRNRDPEFTASELVHEGTHGLDREEHGHEGRSNSIDEEVRTNNNQLDFYEEQQERGYNDPTLNNRAEERNNNNLRGDLRDRYPDAPEQRPL